MMKSLAKDSITPHTGINDPRDTHRPGCTLMTYLSESSNGKIASQLLCYVKHLQKFAKQLLKFCVNDININQLLICELLNEPILGHRRCTQHAHTFKLYVHANMLIRILSTHCKLLLIS